MSTATLDSRAASTRRAGSGYGFGTTARMEWQKLRSIRSTWWIMALFVAGMVGFAILVMSEQHYTTMSAADKASFDPTNNSFVGMVLGQLLFGILGVLAVTTEFSSGLIRATFAAVPNRPLVLAAKAAVVAVAVLVAGEIMAFVSFAVGEAVLKSPAPHATLGQPGVLRAVLMAGAYPALVALLGLALGALIRHTAGGIGAIVGVLLAPPLLLLPFSQSVRDAAQKFFPEPMAANSLTTVKPVAHTLSPAVSFALLCGYAVVLLAIGALALARRDA
jgi:ABC-2 type transport system permease protein